MYFIAVLSTADYIEDVNEEYDIDWNSMAWEELRKPLYSGLAARIYTEEIKPNETDIPRSLEDQGDFYVSYYRPNGDANKFINLAKGLDNGMISWLSLDNSTCFTRCCNLFMPVYVNGSNNIIDYYEAYLIIHVGPTQRLL